MFGVNCLLEDGGKRLSCVWIKRVKRVKRVKKGNKRVKKKG